MKTRQIGPCFAVEVEGIDGCAPLGPDGVAAVHAGMELRVGDRRSVAALRVFLQAPTEQASIRDAAAGAYRSLGGR